MKLFHFFSIFSLFFSEVVQESNLTGGFEVRVNLLVAEDFGEIIPFLL